MKKRRAFTLVELVAVMVVLAVILAIAVPTILNLIRPTTEAAFRNDARIVLTAINLKLAENENIDVNDINVSNIKEKIELSPENYRTISVELVGTEANLDSLAIRVEGQGKWEGLYACGTYQNMKVTNVASRCTGDIVPPLLTVLGDNPHIMYVGEQYIDAGAAAVDDVDGDITDRIMVEGLVNVNKPGIYTIIYTVYDNNENATSRTREIRVLDNVDPVITFSMNGNSEYAKTRSTVVSVSDDGPLKPEGLKYVWSIATEQPDLEAFVNTYNNNQTIETPVDVTGDYYLWVLATDISGNKKYAMSNVFKLDNTPPVITKNGSDVTINKGSSYSDLGATATDNIDGEVIVISSGNVNPNIIGEYEIIYTATDASGNEAIPVTRIVVVRDATAPVITITGDNPHYVILGNSYSDQGAIASDEADGNLTNNIEVTGTVNVNLAATYTVTYTVSDTSGNEAVRTRQVIVQGITQYRYRTSSSSTSCSTCYQTCYNYTTGSPSYSCSSGTLSGTSCVSSYNVYSTFHATYTCYNGQWTFSSHYCTGNCSAPCSNGASPNGYQSGSTCPSGSCSSGSVSCSNYWQGTCYNSTAANVTYICPSGYYGGGSSSTCSQAYSCNPYSCNCSTNTTWSAWSSWSMTAVSSNSTTQVETRTCTSYPCSTT